MGSRLGVNAAEVLYRLAEIELNGVSFYEGMAASAQNPWVKKLAEMLYRAEIRHNKRFLEYAKRAEQRGSAEGSLTVPLEVVRLLRSHVFESKEMGRRAGQYAGDKEAITLAMRAEENLALLLTQLRVYVPKLERVYIDRVIKEEWAHKASLEDIYRRHILARREGV